MMKYLKSSFLLSFLLLLTVAGMTQGKHFVYLQTEDLKPFYIQMNGKTYSSTAAGYLLLGKLTDSIYQIKLGVLGSSDVQEYGIKVAGRDAGYVIRKSAETGWTITDINTGAVQMSMEWSAAVAAENARKKAMEEAAQQRIQDSIASAKQAAIDVRLAAEKQRIHDSINQASAAGAAKPTTNIETEVVSTVSIQPPVVVPAVESKPAKATVVEDAQIKSMSAADSLAQVIAQKEQELKRLMAELQATKDAKAQPALVPDTIKPVVKKTDAISPSNRNSSPDKKTSLLDMEFTMNNDSAVSKTPVTPVKDTAASAGTILETLAAKPTMQAERPAQDTLAKTIAVEEPMAVKKEIEGSKVSPAADSVVIAAAVKRTPCLDILSRSDIDAAINANGKLSNADEIAAAYGALFKSKCVTTTNLKKICNSLASDVSRYKVLEAAYPYTVDYYAFGELAGLIKDNYYSSKFKSLIQQ